MKEQYFTSGTLETEASVIMRRLACRNRRHVPQWDISGAALLVLDMQNVFLNPGSHAFIPSAPAIIPGIRRTIALFRRMGRPVILTRHTNTPDNAGAMDRWWNDRIDPSDPQSMIHPGIHFEIQSNMHTDIETGDAEIIEKHQYDAFHGTHLDAYLQGHAVTRVVITGVMTHICCDSTARAAFHRGYSVFFAVDGTATYTRALHVAAVETLGHCCAVPILLDTLSGTSMSKSD